MKLIVNFSSFFFQRHRRTTYIWYHLLPTLLTLSNYVNSQCFGGVETYEKTSGIYYCIGIYQCFKKKFVKSSALYLHFLFTFCFSGTTVMCETPFCNPRVLLTQPDQSVTRDCIAICKQSSACSSFTVGKRIFERFDI